MEINERKKTNRPIWFLTVAMLSSIYILNTIAWGRYIFFVIAVLILLMYAVNNGGKIRFSIEPFFVFPAVFAVYCLLSAAWAWVPSDAVEKSFTIVQIVACYSFLFLYYQNEDDIESLLSVVMWTGYIVSIYAIWYYGFDTLVRTTANDNLRIINAFNNINSIGMLAAYACVIQIYRLAYDRRLSLTALFMLPAVFIIACTQSRKALILLALGVILVIFIKNFYNRHFTGAVVRTALILGILAVVAWLFLKTGLFTGLNERMESLLRSFLGTGKVDIRTIMRRVGWAQFLKTPILGIGIGSSSVLLNQAIGMKMYLHCNYVELLSCGGIVGFLVYYSMYFYLIRRIVIRGGFSDRSNVICAVLMLLNLIMDYGAVSYAGKTQYFFFMIYYLQARKLAFSEGQSLE